MLAPDSEDYRILFDPMNGEDISIEEVQFLEAGPDRDWRMPRLLEMLVDEDIYVRWCSAQVLAAWAVPEGIQAVSDLIGADVHLHDLSPHRIWNWDQTHHHLARALEQGLSATAEGITQASIIQVARQLLSVFELHYHGERILGDLVKDSLSLDGSLLDEVLAAMERDRTSGRFDQSAVLLKAIARFDPALGWGLVDQFRTGTGGVADHSAAWIADALAYIRTPDSRALAVQIRDQKAKGQRAAERTIELLDTPKDQLQSKYFFW